MAIRKEKGETNKVSLTHEFHAPTVRAMLDLLTVDSDDNGFYYNPANDYGRVQMTWWSGKGDPFEKFAGEALTSKFGTQNGEVVDRPNGKYRLNSKAVKEMIRQLKAQQKKSHKTPN